MNLKVPGSKSIIQRYIVLTILSKSLLKIKNVNFCKDVLTTINIAKKLGVKVRKTKDTLYLDARKIYFLKPAIINTSDSGFNLRVFSVLKNIFKNIKIKREGRRRPLLNKLKKIGKTILLDASISSQPLTGFLMYLAFLEDDFKINVKNLKSTPYVDLTIKILKEFNIRVKKEKKGAKTLFIIKSKKIISPKEVTVEGDFSSASFFMALGAIYGKIKISNLNLKSVQGDKKIINILKKMGVKVTFDKNLIIITKDKLKSFNFDVSDTPDLFPVLFVLALRAKGVSVITGINRLKYKESDRVSSLVNVFKKTNKIKVFKNKIEIEGSDKVIINYNRNTLDHRIAMAFAIYDFPNYKINKCVDKSYPNFYKDLKKIKESTYE